jgi:hypothetical protein
MPTNKIDVHTKRTALQYPLCGNATLAHKFDYERHVLFPRFNGIGRRPIRRMRWLPVPRRCADRWDVCNPFGPAAEPVLAVASADILGETSLL